MEAIEFEGTIQDDSIHVPACYQDWQGRKVKVILLSEEGSERSVAPRSALEILAQKPQQKLFQTADEVDQHIRSEREQWDN